MKKEIADKWIAALESGQYEQAQNFLYDGKGYCCLGVLCKIIGRNFKPTDGITNHYAVEGTTNDSFLPSSVVFEVGMRSSSGEVRKQNTSLAAMNDGNRSFFDIANVIRENWADL